MYSPWMCRPGESPRLAPQSLCHGDGLDQVPDRVNNQQVSVGSGGGGGCKSVSPHRSPGGIVVFQQWPWPRQGPDGGGRKIRLRVFGLRASRDPNSPYSICPKWFGFCRAVSCPMIIQLTVHLHDVIHITVHSPRQSADSFLWSCRYTRAMPRPISENPVIMAPNM